MEANALKEQQAHSPGLSAYAPLGAYSKRSLLNKYNLKLDKM